VGAAMAAVVPVMVVWGPSVQWRASRPLWVEMPARVNLHDSKSAPCIFRCIVLLVGLHEVDTGFLQRARDWFPTTPAPRSMAAPSGRGSPLLWLR